MATINKNRARTPTAEGPIKLGWSNFKDSGERFEIGIDEHRLRLTRLEATELARALAVMLSNPEYTP